MVYYGLDNISFGESFMKLIIEKINGIVYAYRETEKHFKKAEKQRKFRKFSTKDLDKECNLSHYDNDCHFVIDIK